MQVISCRIPLVALGTAVATTAALLGSPSRALAATQGECRVHSLPGFVAQGVLANAASIADVVEVACYHEAGQPVTIDDPEVYARCGNVLNWAQPNPYAKGSGPSFNVTLDSFGNAIAVFWTHACLAGQTTISATLGVAPNTTTRTTFTVYPAMSRPEGFETLPFRQIESGGGVATIIEAEVSRSSEAKMEINATNLLRRCHLKPHLHWIYDGKERTGGRAVRVTLDNNGLGFAVVLGSECQAGQSLITGELIYSPYTSFVTSFAVLPPEEVL